MTYIGQLARTNFTDAWGWGAGNRFYVMDYDGDGDDDLVTRDSAGVFAALRSDRTALVFAGTLLISGLPDNQNWGVGDRFFPMRLNADKKVDLMAHPSAGLNHHFLSTGSALTFRDTSTVAIY